MFINKYQINKGGKRANSTIPTIVSATIVILLCLLTTWLITLVSNPFTPQLSGWQPILDREFLVIKALTDQVFSLFSIIRALAYGWVSAGEYIRSYLFSLFVNQWVKSLPPEALALSLGMSFGDDTRFSQFQKYIFKTIGMQHVVAASGSNVGLVLSLVQVLLSPFWSSQRLLILYFGMVFYTYLVGPAIPILRADVMAGIYLICFYVLHRQYHFLRSLVLTAAIFIVCNFEVVKTLSFQLSFLASLGIGMLLPLTSHVSSWMVGVPSLEQSRFYDPLTDYLKATLISTIAAQIFVMPLLLFQNGQVSVFSLMANVLLLWLVPGLTLVGLVLAALTPWLSLIFSNQWLVNLLLLIGVWPSASIFNLGLESMASYFPQQFAFTLNLTQLALWWLVSVILLKVIGKILVSYRDFARQRCHFFSVYV